MHIVFLLLFILHEATSISNISTPQVISFEQTTITVQEATTKQAQTPLREDSVMKEETPVKQEATVKQVTLVTEETFAIKETPTRPQNTVKTPGTQNATKTAKLQAQQEISTKQTSKEATTRKPVSFVALKQCAKSITIQDDYESEDMLEIVRPRIEPSRCKDNEPDLCKILFGIPPHIAANNLNQFVLFSLIALKNCY